MMRSKQWSNCNVFSLDHEISGRIRILAPFFFFGDLENFPQLTAKNDEFIPLDKKIRIKSQSRKMPAQSVKPCPSTAHFWPTLLAHSHF